jgi:hypothetical protein
VLFQFARLDDTMPNVATSRLIQAAGQPTVWEYRHDLALSEGLQVPNDPHPFLVMFIGINGTTVELPTLDGIAIGLAAQRQIAGYFESDGTSAPSASGFLPPGYDPNLFQIPANLPENNGYATLPQTTQALQPVTGSGHWGVKTPR